MKKILSLALVAQVLLVSYGAEAQYGRPYPGPYHHHGHSRGGNNIGGFITGLIVGGGIALVLSNLSRADRVSYDVGFNACFNQFQCGNGYARPIVIQNQPYNVHIDQGQRVYYGNPAQNCRSYQEVITDRRGRVVNTQTKYACLQNNQWLPPPAGWGQPRFFDQQHNRHMRDWRSAPVIMPNPGGVVRTQPYPQPYPAPVYGPGRGGSAPVVVAPRPSGPTVYPQPMPQQNAPVLLPPRQGIR